MVAGRKEYTPTPVISHATYQPLTGGSQEDLADGIVINTIA